MSKIKHYLGVCVAAVSEEVIDVSQLSKRESKRVKTIQGPRNANGKRLALAQKLRVEATEKMMAANEEMMAAIKKMMGQEFDRVKRGDFSSVRNRGTKFLVDNAADEKQRQETLSSIELYLECYSQEILIHADNIEEYFEPLLKTLPLEKTTTKDVVFDLLYTIFSRFDETYQRIKNFGTQKLNQIMTEAKQDRLSFLKRTAEKFYQSWIDCSSPGYVKDFYASRCYKIFQDENIQKDIQYILDIRKAAFLKENACEAWGEELEKLITKYPMLNSEWATRKVAELEKAGAQEAEQRFQKAVPQATEEFHQHMATFEEIRDEVTKLQSSKHSGTGFSKRVKSCEKKLRTLIEQTQAPAYAEIACFLKENQRVLEQLSGEARLAKQAASQDKELKKYVPPFGSVPAAKPLLFSTTAKKVAMAQECVKAGETSDSKTQTFTAEDNPSVTKMEEKLIKKSSAEIFYKQAIQAMENEKLDVEKYEVARGILQLAIQAAKSPQDDFTKAAAFCALSECYRIEAGEKEFPDEYNEALSFYDEAIECAKRSKLLCQALRKGNATVEEDGRIEDLLKGSCHILEWIKTYTQELEKKWKEIVKEHEAWKKSFPHKNASKPKSSDPLEAPVVSEKTLRARFCKNNIHKVQAINQKAIEATDLVQEKVNNRLDMKF